MRIVSKICWTFFSLSYPFCCALRPPICLTTWLTVRPIASTPPSGTDRSRPVRFPQRKESQRPILVLIATICALSVSALFALILFIYLALTLAYSFTLKRRLIVDVVVLATLYTIRVIAGAAAIPVVPSEWLLAFSMFIFFCLALAKRYVELAMRLDKDLPDPSNRNYRLMDLPTIGALAAASGFNAITIFALYVNSPTVSGLYRHQQVLWLICPILMYWLSRILVLAHRRVLDDDPIVFALQDRNSRICVAAMIAIVLLAI